MLMAARTRELGLEGERALRLMRHRPEAAARACEQEKIRIVLVIAHVMSPALCGREGVTFGDETSNGGGGKFPAAIAGRRYREAELDDPDLLLFTCTRCGFWPMAHQAKRPFTLEAEFTCPRCHEHASMRIRQPSRRLLPRQPPDTARE